MPASPTRSTMHNNVPILYKSNSSSAYYGPWPHFTFPNMTTCPSHQNFEIIASCLTFSKHLPCSHHIFTRKTWIPTTSTDMLINTPAFFKCDDASACINHPGHKVTKFGHTPSSYILWNISHRHLLPLTTFTCPNKMAFQVTMPPDGILLNTPPTSSSSILAQNHFPIAPIATNKEAQIPCFVANTILLLTA